MYTNIPTDIIFDIITETLHKQDTYIQTTREIILITVTILDQNYFVHKNQMFQQHEGLPMGAPTSAILSEIFLRYLEHNNNLSILSKHHVDSYNRYVDDILIICNNTRTNTEVVLAEFNKIHKNLQFTMEQESNNTIKYLDISILRNNDKLEYNIYSKPTTSSTVIHASSFHPIEHERMAFNYSINRVDKYPLSLENMKIELNIIRQTAKENNYSHSIIKRKQCNRQDINMTVNNPHENTQLEKKWVTFTYIGKETRHITKLFKNTTVKTAYKTRNTVKRLLQPKLQQERENKYNRPGAYKLKCNEFHLQYVGQKGLSFLTRYKEHIRAIKYNKDSTAYAQHILNTGHSYGKI
jgi:hypothetical protein